MALNVLGIWSVAIFYLLILLVGIGAACIQKRRRRCRSDSISSQPQEDIMLASRNLSLVAGVFTMTATWVGGGYVNGSAEEVFTNGIIWCQTPFGYSLALLLGGLFFAKPMRDKGYVTMIDPFQIKYGPYVGGLLFFPALFGETIWTASILSALGSTLSVILDLNNSVAVLSSAAIAVLYTFFGGMFSVAMTDVVQLFFIVFGLVLCTPFAWMHPAVNREVLVTQDWFGRIETKSIGLFMDYYLLLIFGGIPYQAYFQRVLSVRTSHQAQVLSYSAAILCAVLAIPSILLGGIAKSTDWINGTEYGQALTTGEQTKHVLPLVLNYLTPQWVSFFGLGAVSAAVMSSADSCILSASSMFTHNIYRGIFCPKASGTHLAVVLRISILIVAVLASGMAIAINSIYALSLLCSDLVYVMLFPQLLLVVHAEGWVNKYGCLSSFIVGLVLRILGGEKLLGLPALLQFPFFSEGQQYFPFRTFIMLISLCVHLMVSFVSRECFSRSWLSPKYDFLQCFGPTLQITMTDDDVRIEGSQDDSISPSSLEVADQKETDRPNNIKLAHFRNKSQ